jgi:hypothetical protein
MGAVSGMSTHGITFVDDTELADGHDFALIALPDGGVWIFFGESAVTPETLEDSWTAYRAVVGIDREPEPHWREAALDDPRQLRLVM